MTSSLKTRPGVCFLAQHGAARGFIQQLQLEHAPASTAARSAGGRFAGSQRPARWPPVAGLMAFTNQLNHWPAGPC